MKSKKYINNTKIHAQNIHILLFDATTFPTLSKTFSVLRNNEYNKTTYRDSCTKLVGIPFSIHTKLHTEQDLNDKIQNLHCISALRKVLYDTLHFQIPLCYIQN